MVLVKKGLEIRGREFYEIRRMMEGLELERELNKIC